MLIQLASTGGESARLGRTPASLASIDQLHVGQLESTIAFADWIGLDPGARVLDLGAGLGGPARFLAATRGADVWAVEVVPELHDAAVALTARLGLGDRVHHELAEIGASGAVGPFDLVWIEHVDMHVPDKRGLYASAASRLGPRGRVVWHDWLAGPAGPPHWPLFWSADGGISFLSAEAAFREDLAASGLALHRFEPIADTTRGWLSRSKEALARALAQAAASSAPDAGKIARVRRLLDETDNALRSVDEGRLVPFFAEARAR